MNPDLYDQMHQSAEFLQKKGIQHVDCGIILGSGLTDVEDGLEDSIHIPYAEIPFLPVPGAPGHRGVLLYGTTGGKRVLIFSGRVHYYEGYPLWQTTFAMRIMQALGVPHVILTAAVGSLTEDIHPGDLVVITDHINLMPDNPLRGIPDERLGERFTDLSGAYDPEWTKHLMSLATQLNLNFAKGVYACLQGPSLETQAECEFLRRIGANVVGMSVVPEVIVGVQAGIRVAAITSVANMAWHPGSILGATVPEILNTSAQTAPALARLLQMAVHTLI